MSSLLEILIGGTNLSLAAFLVLCGVTFLGSLLAGALGLGGGVLVLATMANLLPPTVLMGGTIPVLTQALSARLEEATRVHAWVYSFNAAGAFVGALAGVGGRSGRANAVPGEVGAPDILFPLHPEIGRGKANEIHAVRQERKVERHRRDGTPLASTRGEERSRTA